MKFLQKVQNLPTNLEGGVLYYATEDNKVGLKKTELWELDPTRYLVDADGKYYEYLYDPSQRTIEDRPAIIDLNGNEWTKFDEDENYDYYKSMNQGIDNSYYQFCVTWSGVENVQFLYRSYAESTYDYLVVGTLDDSKFTSSPYDTDGQANTKGNQTTTYNTLDITCTTDEHHIWFCYRKDGSAASNDDTAYVGVPKLQTIVDGKTKMGEELSVFYNVDNVSSPSVNWSATTATITYDGNTILSNGLIIDTNKLSQVVEFEQNSPQGDNPMDLSNTNTEFVDLGLPSGLKWAKCNLGAQSETEVGAYFSWGDTNGYATATDKGGSSTARDITDKFLWNDVEVNYTVKQGGTSGNGFTWATDKWNGGASSYDATYFASVSGDVCPNGVLAAQYDAAHMNMGGSCRMPTTDEFIELYLNTTNAWYASGNTEFNGVVGRKFTASNGNYIFIPTAGYGGESDVYGVGSYAYVWSSNLISSSPRNAYHLYFYSSYVKPLQDNISRYQGFSVRAVSKN